MKLFNKYLKLFLEQADDSVTSSDEIRRFIQKIRLVFRNRNMFFSFLLEKVPIIIVPPNDSRIKTMAVDEKGNLYINFNFARDLLDGTEPSFSDPNLKEDPRDEYYRGTSGQKSFTGVIAHELQHIYSDHIARMFNTGRTMKISGPSGQPTTLWNIATDLEINDNLLYNWGYTLPKKGIITDPDGSYEFNGEKVNVRGLSPERIYDMLQEIINKNPQPPQPPQPQPTGDPVDINVGDIVYDPKTKKYGEVTTIDSSGKAKMVEITEQEAKQRVYQS